MKVDPYLDTLRQEFLEAAAARGDEARSLAETLVLPLDSAVRLTLLAVLSDAADEITDDLLPGTVEIRLRGLDPTFVVTPPPDFEALPRGAVGGGVPDERRPADPALDEDGATARINFRPPTQLKTRIDEAAAAEGLSVNAWLVQIADAALQSGGRNSQRRARPDGVQRFSGWVR